MRLFKIVLPVLALTIILGGFSLVSIWSQPVEAQTEDSSVSGWAWSETIGWIDMNSVTIDQMGQFNGYGWSENIGWIDFNPNGPYPEAPQNGVFLTSGNVIGWARAVAGDTVGSGGWSGWIKMSGSGYGVTVGENGEFSGYAWGGGGTNLDNAVIGWIDMSGVTTQLSDDPDPDPENVVFLEIRILSGQGTVTGDQGGISCDDISAPCMFSFDNQLNVELAATSDNAGEAITWGEAADCEVNQENCTVTITGTQSLPTIVTVVFGEPVEPSPLIEITGLDSRGRLRVWCQQINCTENPFYSLPLTIINKHDGSINLNYHWDGTPAPGASLIGPSSLSVGESGEFKVALTVRGIPENHLINIIASAGEKSETITFRLHYYDPTWEEE